MTLIDLGLLCLFPVIFILAKAFDRYTRPQRQRVVFPTMLRKMWSGGEVQAWLDENVNKE